MKRERKSAGNKRQIKRSIKKSKVKILKIT